MHTGTRFRVRECNAAPVKRASVFVAQWAARLLFLTFSTALCAQDYPNRLLKFIVPYAPGAGNDAMARFVAEKLQGKLGQAVIVENRAGAGGNIGAEAVFKAAPDGYTLLFTAPGPLVTNKSLYTRLAYDPDAFVPVSMVATSPSIVAVHPKAGVGSLQQLIAFAKANPDRLNYASGGTASTPHLATELFKSMAEVRIVHIPYNGSGPALASLVAGQVEVAILGLGSVLPHIRAGTVRALAVGTEKRISSLPEVPTVSEILPGYLSVAWFGVVAPPKTAPAIADKLSAAIAEVLKQPDLAKRMLDQSYGAVGSTPAELAIFIKEERERWGNVIRATGAKLD